jgi:hypothetical protein
MPQINGVDVTPQQEAIHGLIARFAEGVTDHALVPVATHEMKIVYSESGIRSRRAELARKGLVKPVGQVQTRRGRYATRWAAV